jgi:glucose-1-phosphate cytidylyltransferase
VQKYAGEGPFLLTYGDGLSDVNIKKLVDFHKKNKNLATLTAIRNAGRFGVIDLTSNDKVTTFLEKPKEEGGWISGGFFVLEPGIFDFLTKGDATVWEQEPLQELAKDGNLGAYRHDGYWGCMDTLRDKIEMEGLWKSGKAPWKVW